MNTKICPQCNKEFNKPTNCSEKNWVIRKFCSRLCKQKSPEVRNKVSNSNKGKHREGRPCSEETKIKIGLGNKGKRHSEETKKLIGEKGKGKPSWNKGKKSPWVSQRNKDNPMKKEKHPNWKGGKSFELYGFDFTQELKTLIRTRDKFTCHFCNKNGYDVHHIDYNKKNCNPENLITLCRSCHIKTNWNRPKWLEYFKNYLSLT